MSGNDVSVTETAQSDQYPMPTIATATAAAHHEYYRYRKQQQQQQQSCLREPRQLQQEHQLANRSGEFDELHHWPSTQHGSSTGGEGGVGSSGSGGGGKIYITPADIPPPPHPPNTPHLQHNGNRSRHPHPHIQHHRTPPHRCKCDHPIELLGYEGAAILRHQHPPYYFKASATSSSRHPSTKLPEAIMGGGCLDNEDLTSAGSFGDGMSRFKNLVHSNEKKRRMRIIISVIAAVLVVAIIATTLVLTLGSDNADDNGNNNGSNDNAIDLEDVLTNQFYAKRFNGSWSNGDNVIYKENGSIMEYDVRTKLRKILLEDAAQYVLYEKSADGQFLLLAKNYKKNFRYSFLAEYDICNISSKAISSLNIQDEQRYLSMVQWSPVGNALVINYDRNLYYKQNALDTEIALTNDSEGAILNGIPDWVYEEEVFSSNVATWFNPSGTQLAFIRFDDSSTHLINFPYYGDAGDLRYQYPLHQVIAYPKAGSSNPGVQLVMVNLTRAVAGNELPTIMPVPSALNTVTDYIVTVVNWVDDAHVLSVWMNRIQNAAYIVTFDGLTRKEIYSTESKTGWVDLYTAPFKNRNATRLAFVLPHNNYKHLQLLNANVSSAELQQLEPLTDGKYVVDSILYWDGATDIIFYTANTEEHPEQLHLYAIEVTSSTRKQAPKCLTCKLIHSGDVEQSYYSAIFNDNNEIVITSLGPGIPTTAIYEWKLSDAGVVLSKLLDWETNEVLRSKLQGVALPTHEVLTFNIDNGFQAKVLLQLPPNIDKSGNTKYPLLVDVYGGPDSYSVTNKWILDWGTYLSSNQSVIYAKIDGRGSGLRGENLLHAIYLQLGTVEISDQISVTQNITNLNYVDEKHVGIWGWSYGGYAAAMALTNDNYEVFKCAASIAPVTDWAYYDSIYTERYMGLPTINEIGYANSRLSTRAQKLRGKKFLLVHGTLDDNVHYQQAMILAKNLERHDILFKQISYADEDHGLANVRPHLYHSLDRFFGECFASNRLMKSAK
ncbi:venom dipeptidyl peptidase 4 isoform X1 [Drosophila willistoni]|uniref:venom dipeptidyl peptidase 4 isoform X1 n=2 Tax=Drosophila willistoni TaxID=7260 RepID=UPI000C26D42F|nr:venom dipeptidyl peptidase 4 isoform X1 [Drosophila willistoni]